MDSIYLSGSDDVRRGGALAAEGGADMLRAANIMIEAADRIRTSLQEHTESMQRMLEEHREEMQKGMKPADDTLARIAATKELLHEHKWVHVVNTSETKCEVCGVVIP